MRISARIRMFAASAISTMFLSGCGLGYARYAEYDRGVWDNIRVFNASRDDVWNAMMLALENFPIAFTDRQACFIRTDELTADSLTVFRLGWMKSEPETDFPAFSRYTIHLSCTPAGDGQVRVKAYIREKVLIPVLRLVPTTEHPRTLLAEIVPARQAPGGGETASIGYREQLLLAAIGKLLGEEMAAVELEPVSKVRCIAAFDDDGSPMACPGKPVSKPLSSESEPAQSRQP